MIDINWTVGVQILNFLVLIWAMNYFMYGPIRNMLKKRGEKVEGLEKGIEDAARQAGEKENEFASGIKNARAKGLEEKEAILEAASSEEKDIVGRINEKAQADLAGIKEKIAGEAEEARKTLMKEIDIFANDIGQKILGRAV